MANNRGQNNSNKKNDDKKGQPEKRRLSNSLYSAITVFLGSCNWTKADSCLKEWLGELSEMERYLVEAKFKSIDPLSGSAIIGSVVSLKSIDDRYSAAKNFGLFGTLAVNIGFERIFLKFEKDHPNGATNIENFIVSLSNKESEIFRFSLTQNEQQAQDILLSISLKRDLNEMKKSAKSRNLL